MASVVRDRDPTGSPWRSNKRWYFDCYGHQNGTSFAANLNARKNADGFWYVAVTWGNGRKERLGPYKTEAVAQELIKAQLAHGMRAKSYF